MSLRKRTGDDLKREISNLQTKHSAKKVLAAEKETKNDEPISKRPRVTRKNPN